MRTHSFQFAGHVTDPKGAAPKGHAAFEKHMDELADHLGELDDVIDPFVSSNLDTGMVEVWMTIEAETELEALECAIARLRAAIHAAGGNTAGWENIRIVESDDDQDASMHDGDLVEA